MPVEGPINSIADLNPLNPLGEDTRKQGDDHLRLIKDAIKKTWPNVNGEISFTQNDANYLTGVIAGIALSDKVLVLDSASDLLSGIHDFFIDNNLTVKGLELVLESAVSILKANGTVELPNRNAAISIDDTTGHPRKAINSRDGGPNSPDLAIRFGHYISGISEVSSVGSDSAALIKYSGDNRTEGRLDFKVAVASVDTDDPVVWNRRLKLESNSNLQVDNGNGYNDVIDQDAFDTESSTINSLINKSKARAANDQNGTSSYAEYRTLTSLRNHNGNLLCTVSCIVQATGTSTGQERNAYTCKIRVKRPDDSVVNAVTWTQYQDLIESDGAGNESRIVNKVAICQQFYDESPQDGTYTVEIQGDDVQFTEGVVTLSELS